MKKEFVEDIFGQINSYPVGMVSLSEAIEWHEGDEPLVEEEMLREALRHLEIDIDDLYYDENAFAFLDRFIYFDGLVWVGISNFQMDYLEFAQIKKHIHGSKEMLAKYMSEDNWSMVFLLMNKKVSMSNFAMMYEHVPKSDVIDVFSEVWVRAEFGFEVLDFEIIKEIYSTGEPTDRFLQGKSHLRAVADDQGFLTIYRGANDLTDDSLSWSLKREVAEWFSSRFDKVGTIQEAKVHVDNVIDYFDFRNEYEVLVFPEDVIN